MSKVKVSVIVPVFNVGEYLSTSLDSILNQTLEAVSYTHLRAHET